MLRNYRVCLLNEKETIAYLHRGIMPDCHGKNHIHIRLKEAEKRMSEDRGMFLDPEKKIMEARAPRLEVSRVWEPRVSGGVRVLQLVRGVVQGRTGHFVYPVGAVGARERRTTVRATNKTLLEAALEVAQA